MAAQSGRVTERERCYVRRWISCQSSCRVPSLTHPCRISALMTEDDSRVRRMPLSSMAEDERRQHTADSDSRAEVAASAITR